MPVQHSPQQLLDEINQIGISNLYTADLSSKERTAHIKIAKQKLKTVKQFLKTEQEAIKKRWDGRKADEAERESLELAPYTLVGQIIDSIDTALLELETAIQFDNPLPETQEKLYTIVGGERYGSYVITSTPEAAQDWIQEEEQKIRNAEVRAQAELFRNDIQLAMTLMRQGEYRGAQHIFLKYHHPKAQAYAVKAEELAKKQDKRRALRERIEEKRNKRQTFILKFRQIVSIIIIILGIMLCVYLLNIPK